MSDTPHCPDCGSPLSGNGWSEELCPHCLLKLALVESSDEEVEATGALTEATEAMPAQSLSPGQVLGRRYGVRSLLGRGGMGEVWRAFDLKLRVDVALKTIRADLLAQQRVLDTLRREVRAAREVASANVCRVYDLEELDGRELVSMEYVTGETLRGVLSARGPLDIQEAREIAAQFLAGLEAIHRAGLVHRDLKPENVMITPARRVVVMDFGIAKGLAEAGTGTVAGTPAYMAPEQNRGEPVDARADVYSAGVVLAEMLAVGDVGPARQALLHGVRQHPPQLPDSPWREVLEQAVAHDREQRHPTAATLARALEEVTIRVEGAEDVRPYPGLVAFGPEDREYFFGRELEVEAVWKKIRRLSMLALIGPSGAGKTSFLKAGLLANSPAGWSHVTCTPGEAPLTALRQALVPRLSGDSDAMRELVTLEDSAAMVSAVARWRGRERHALLVVDQFEELFTLNPPEVQAGFAELLGRLALDSDVRVLLSMRDDFLFLCHGHERLKPILSELTLIGPPTGTALRRAVVQPALKCGYRFEDEALVDEMLAEVEGERGALPLVAFAASELWERRDRERGQLTREAYELIGGVAGALAQHAELSLERIGRERLPVVRELFRNLVTAQGTRAARNRDELLSVFASGDRAAAAEVLDGLVDSRLLTTYSVEGGDGGETTTQRIEIVHESLLTAWPRLVRWMTQDVEGARLRDDLRQAARRWSERDRPDDLVWTGSAFREYQVWRERYPGRLSELEETFARAMGVLATRRRRRLRLLFSSAFTAVALVALVLGVLLHHSLVQTRRAEASKLLALGELELGSYPTAALAWATASLELTDSDEARRLALRTLQKDPPVTIDPVAWDTTAGCEFSPDGKWLVDKTRGQPTVRFHDGRAPMTVGETERPRACVHWGFSPEGQLVTSVNGVHRWWQLPDVSVPMRTETGRGWLNAVQGDGYLSLSEPQWCPVRGLDDETVEEGMEAIYRFPFDTGPGRLVGVMRAWDWRRDGTDANGRWLAYLRGGRDVHLRSLEDWSREPLRLGELEAEVASVAVRADGGQVAAVDKAGAAKIWNAVGGSTELERSIELDGAFGSLAYGPGGRWLALDGTHPGGGASVWLVDLEAPLGAAPLELRSSEYGYAFPDNLAFHPSGDWLATNDWAGIGFWPLSHSYPLVFDLDGREPGIAFTPDSRWLVSVTSEGTRSGGAGQVRAWPLAGQNGGAYRVLLEQPSQAFYLADLEFDPVGEYLAVGSQVDGGRVFVVPMAGGAPRELECSVKLQARGGDNYDLAFSPDGRRLAAAPIKGTGEERYVQVWDLESGDRREVGPVLAGSTCIRWVDDHRIAWAGGFSEGGAVEEKVFDLETGIVQTGVPGRSDEWLRVVSSSGSFMLTVHGSHAVGFDLALRYTDRATGESHRITNHGDDPWTVALDPSEELMVTGGASDGLVRIGPVTGEEPHLLYGHDGWVFQVSVSPDGRWIASVGEDWTMRLWPMPDPSKPPLHTLDRDRLISKLRSLTNLRAVRDDSTPTGWKVEVGAFPGWAEVPTW